MTEFAFKVWVYKRTSYGELVISKGILQKQYWKNFVGESCEEATLQTDNEHMRCSFRQGEVYSEGSPDDITRHCSILWLTNRDDEKAKKAFREEIRNKIIWLEAQIAHCNFILEEL